MMARLAELGQTIAQYGAPILGQVVAGPMGNQIGQMVANLFGGNINDPLDLANKIRDDKDAHIKLKEIEFAQEAELKRLTILQAENALKYSNANTADARRNNQGSDKAPKTYYPEILSTFVVLGFFANLYWVAVFSQDQSDQQILNILLGVLGSAFSAVVNYWLGSSADIRKN